MTPLGPSAEQPRASRQTDPMEIRDAIESDIDTITDIFNQAIPAGDAEWTETMH